MRRPPSVVELGFWEAEAEVGGSFVAGPPSGAGRLGLGRDGLGDRMRSGTVGVCVGGGVTVLSPEKRKIRVERRRACSVASTAGGAFCSGAGPELSDSWTPNMRSVKHLQSLQ